MKISTVKRSAPKLSFYLVIFLTLLFSGCAHKYPVKIDALKSPSYELTPGSKFYVLPPEGMTKDLRFEELRGIVEKAFQKRGYVLAGSPDEAELKIISSFRISDPIQTLERRMDPIYYETHAHTRVIARPVFNKDGSIAGYRYSEIWVPRRREFAGYTDQSTTVTVFDKILHLSALTGSGDNHKEVWAMSLYNRSKSKDLRRHLPYLMAAGMPYIGKKTDGEIEVLLEEENSDLLYLDNERKSSVSE